MKVVSFMGFKGDGKDSAASALIEKGYVKFAFADAIKDVLAVVFSWDRKLLEGNTKESREWRETVDVWWAIKLGIPDFTPRKAMTLIGTDVMRKYLHNDLWVLSTYRKITDSGCDKVMLTDVRHEHEIIMVESMLGVKNPLTIFVEKPVKPAFWGLTSVGGVTTHAKSFMAQTYPDVHVSEWEWNTHANQKAVSIMNTGTLDELQDAVRAVEESHSWN